MSNRYLNFCPIQSSGSVSTFWSVCWENGPNKRQQQRSFCFSDLMFNQRWGNQGSKVTAAWRRRRRNEDLGRDGGNYSSSYSSSSSSNLSDLIWCFYCERLRWCNKERIRAAQWCNMAAPHSWTDWRHLVYVLWIKRDGWRFNPSPLSSRRRRGFLWQQSEVGGHDCEDGLILCEVKNDAELFTVTRHRRLHGKQRTLTDLEWFRSDERYLIPHCGKTSVRLDDWRFRTVKTQFIFSVDNKLVQPQVVLILEHNLLFNLFPDIWLL